MTYTVTLSTAPTVDETFTFDVDGVERTITVLAGQTTGTTTVAYDDAVDVFIPDADETVGRHDRVELCGDEDAATVTNVEQRPWTNFTFDVDPITAGHD